MMCNGAGGTTDIAAIQPGIPHNVAKADNTFPICLSLHLHNG